MTEIAIRHDRTSLALPQAPDRPGSDIVADLGRWLEAASLAQKIAEVACRGPFVPKAFQGRPEHAAIAILSGAELGLSPGMSLRSFHVIEGTASLSAKTMRALILGAGHELELVEETDDHVTMRGRRRGERDWTEITFSMRDAEIAGLLGKDVWKKWPKRMMTARVTTILGDLKFGDCLAGMPCQEVLEDGSLVEATAYNVPEDAPTRTSAAAILARAEQAAPAPSTDRIAELAGQAMAEAVHEVAAALDEPKIEQYVMPVSKQKLDLIKAAFERHDLGATRGQVGAEQREKRMRVLSSLLGRPITDPRELTADEGTVIVDNLGTDDGARVIAEILDPDPSGDYAAEQATAAVDEDDYAAAVQQDEDDAARAEAAGQQ